MNNRELDNLEERIAARLKNFKESRGRLIYAMCRDALNDTRECSDHQHTSHLASCMGRRLKSRQKRFQKEIIEQLKEEALEKSLRDKAIEANEHICPID